MGRASVDAVARAFDVGNASLFARKNLHLMTSPEAIAVAERLLKDIDAKLMQTSADLDACRLLANSAQALRGLRSALLQSQEALQALAEKWEAAAVWEYDEMSNPQSAQTFDQCAHELLALISPPVAEHEWPTDPPAAPTGTDAGAQHRCAGCGHRWAIELTGGELCGDCWRKVQPVLHGTDAGVAALVERLRVNIAAIRNLMATARALDDTSIYLGHAAQLEECAAALAQQATQLERVTQERDNASERGLQFLLAKGEAESRLAEQATQLQEARQERDEAISQHGAESGFWGRAAARAVDRRNKAESQLTSLRAELETAQQERDGWIEPLKQSDDPEEAEACRMTPTYVLLSRVAADCDAEVHRKRRIEMQQLRSQLAEARRALDEAKAGGS